MPARRGLGTSMKRICNFQGTAYHKPYNINTMVETNNNTTTETNNLTITNNNNSYETNNQFNNNYN